jgi:cell division protein FtsL
MYVDGSAVRKLQEVPDRRVQPGRPPQRRESSETEERVRREESRTLSKNVQRNRARAAGINKGFVIFLSVVSIAILGVSVQYLQLKSQITSSMKQVASLESELTQLKEENDAYYSQVTNSVDMSKIKKIAIGRLGMKYPSEDQTETYQTARSSYVRQYQDIPESK